MQRHSTDQDKEPQAVEIIPGGMLHEVAVPSAVHEITLDGGSDDITVDEAVANARVRHLLL